MQANGAEMLRLACCLATERGVAVCAPVHDALLVEGPAGEIQDVVAETQAAMAEASRVVLSGFELRSDAKVVRHPDRYTDPRGERIPATKPLGPYTWKGGLNINRDAKGVPIIHAQQTHVAQLPTPGGLCYVWMGDRWGSTPDTIKGHDFQYWAPLEFSQSGSILPLKWVDDWKIGLPE